MKSGQGPPRLTGRETTHLGKFPDGELHGLPHSESTEHVKNDVAAKRHLPEHIWPWEDAVASVPRDGALCALDSSADLCYACLEQEVSLLAKGKSRSRPRLPTRASVFNGPSFDRYHPSLPRKLAALHCSAL